MDRDEDQQWAVWKMRYLLLFCSSQLGLPSFHSCCQLLHLPPFLLAEAFKGCGQSLRYAARYAGVPAAAFDCLDSSLETLSPYCTVTASLRQYILWYFVDSTWLWALEEVAIGGWL